MPCTADLERRDYLDFLPKRPQGTTKILGTPAFAGTKTPAALKFSSKDATTDCAETPVNCPHCGQKWRLRRRLRRQPFILLSFSSSEKPQKRRKRSHTNVSNTLVARPSTPQPLTAHTAAYTPKQGLFRMGALLLPSERFTRFGNPAWPGVRTANFAAFEPWPEALSKNAESLRSSDALTRVAAPRRRGPAGLRCSVCNLVMLLFFHSVRSTF